jgi:nitrogen fixation protein NifB
MVSKFTLPWRERVRVRGKTLEEIKMDINNHPCFNEGACRTYGRIHLPVAPLCNVQCNFCNRKYDCVNETRPGVTSSVLSPYQASLYLDDMLAEKKNISVVGIAGPGDPFANPVETLKTLEFVRKNHPDILLCLATNGLNLLPYVDEIVDLKVSHVSITVNAVDPAVGEKIYAWVRNGKRTMKPREGAAILLANQLSAISLLKAKGMIVKINSVVLPGINEDHISKIAEKMGAMGVDIFNCMPYSPCPGSRFENIGEPGHESIKAIRQESLQYVKQMYHCTRCRADAAGLLSEKHDQGAVDKLKRFSTVKPLITFMHPNANRPNVAVASMEGTLVNRHLGEADRLFIYGFDGDKVFLADTRETPEPGGGPERWKRLSEVIADCRALLVSGVGASPKESLLKSGVEIFEVEGMIEDAVRAVFLEQGLNEFIKRRPTRCGAECGGMGMGCG